MEPETRGVAGSERACTLLFGDHHDAATPAVTRAIEVPMTAGDAVDATEEQARLVEAGRCRPCRLQGVGGPGTEAVTFKPQSGPFDVQARRVHRLLERAAIGQQVESPATTIVGDIIVLIQVPAAR